MIDFEKGYILENEKILLRPLRQDDYANFLEFSVNEPEIWEYNARGADGEENLKKYIHDALFGRANKTEYPFAVIDKMEKKVVGSTRLYLINTAYNTAELGFTWYGKKYQGTYINKNCKFLMLRFAFEDFGLERVGFKANNLNLRSIKAMESLGCKREGTLRNFALDAKNRRIDVAVLSILREEWLDGLKENLLNKISNADVSKL